jgi:hypothetical protein
MFISNEKLKQSFYEVYSSLIEKLESAQIRKTGLYIDSNDLFEFILFQLIENFFYISVSFFTDEGKISYRNSFKNFKSGNLKGVLFFCEPRFYLLDDNDAHCDSHYKNLKIKTLFPSDETFALTEMEFIGFNLKIYLCFGDSPKNYITKDELEKTGLDFFDYDVSESVKIVGLRSCVCDGTNKNGA